MYKGNSVLGIIPARGGSKGIFRKNIREFAGKPLIAWTLMEAQKSKYIDCCVISTEDEEISGIAKSYGGNVPFLRPLELANDDTASIDVVLHVLERMPKYDYIVLLQPTSPLRTVDDIDGAIVQCMDNCKESCVSVVEAEHSPYWMYNITDQNRMIPLLNVDAENSYQRQKLPKIYRLNGAVYVNSCDSLVRNRKLVWEDTMAFIMSAENSYDIDTLLDFNIAEMLMKNRKS